MNMKPTLTLAALCAISLFATSCKTSSSDQGSYAPGSNGSNPYATTGGGEAGGANPYSSYPSYGETPGAPPQNSYPNDGDYVAVEPITTGSGGQDAYSYQPPAYGDTATYTPQTTQPATQTQAPAYPPESYDTYASNTSSGGGAGSYQVVKGDTLYSISRRHRTTVQAIKSANGLSNDTIFPGDVLNIPNG